MGRVRPTNQDEETDVCDGAAEGHRSGARLGIHDGEGIDGSVPGVVKSAGWMAAWRLVSGIGGLARGIDLGETKAPPEVFFSRAESRFC